MHEETHAVTRIGWLRAAILGANDGIVSTASLIAGVAAAGATSSSILVTGTAGLVAGAMSMAAGEYVSVSSQGDAEKSDIELEKRHLAADPEFELEELTEIYQQRGLDRALAEQVAVQLTAHDALDTHLRDELGMTDAMAARPVQAAAASATSFAIGAALPLAMVLVDRGESLPLTVSAASLVFLAILGALGARAGNAPMLRPVVRGNILGRGRYGRDDRDRIAAGNDYRVTATKDPFGLSRTENKPTWLTAIVRPPVICMYVGRAAFAGKSTGGVRT